MYVYEDSVALSRSAGSQWEHQDLSAVTLAEIYAKYVQIYLVVADSIVEGSVFVDMNYYRTAMSTSTLTVVAWLANMTGRLLVTVEELPSTGLASARYANAVLHNYKLELTKAGFPYPEQMPVTELTDLSMVRQVYPTDMELVHKYCLVSVNGFYHRTDYASGKAYILDGGITSMKARCSHTGILSFLDIGAIKQLQLTDENIMPLTEGAPLIEGIIIKTDEVLTDKSTLFILGGYMIQPEKNVFFQNSEGSWVLNLMGLPYYERIMESIRSIDLSSLNIEHLDTNPEDAFVQESLRSDSVIKAYLKLSQSFLAIVDTPVLYFNRINVRVSNLPGLITSYQDPLYPLVMGYGKSVEYSKVSEEQYWALRVADDWYVQYAWQTTPTRGVTTLTNQYKTWKPYLRTQGYLLEIKGKEKT